MEENIEAVTVAKPPMIPHESVTVPQGERDLDETRIHTGAETSNELLETVRQRLTAYSRNYSRIVGEQDRRALVQIAKEELAGKGYGNWMSIAFATASEFRTLSFAYFGGPKALYAAVTGKSSQEVSTSFSCAHLREMADTLHPLSEEERREELRTFFREYGYGDRASLEHGDITVFIAHQFGKYGKGLWMYNLVMGERLRSLRQRNLVMLADKLYPTTPDEKMDALHSQLATGGFPDHNSLVTTYVKPFEQTDFGPVGKGLALYNNFVGRTKRQMKRNLVNGFADLVYPVTEEEQIEYFRSLLREHGYIDHWSLEYGSPADFCGKQFGTIGKANSFYREMTGKTLGDGAPFRHSQMKEIADRAYPITAEQRLEYYRSLLRANGIYLKEELLQTMNRDFLAMDFGLIGKGRSFYIAVTGKTIERFFEKRHTEELAAQLFDVHEEQIPEVTAPGIPSIPSSLLSNEVGGVEQPRTTAAPITSFPTEKVSVKKVRQPDAFGFFVDQNGSHRQRYGTLGAWSLQLAISDITLQRRLEGIPGLDCHDSSGTKLSTPLFLEADVRRVCDDLLTSGTLGLRANDSGFFVIHNTAGTERYGTAQVWMQEFDLDVDDVKKACKGMEGVTAMNVRKILVKSGYYPETFIRILLAQKIEHSLTKRAEVERQAAQALLHTPEAMTLSSADKPFVSLLIEQASSIPEDDSGDPE